MFVSIVCEGIVRVLARIRAAFVGPIVDHAQHVIAHEPEHGCCPCSSCCPLCNSDGFFPPLTESEKRWLWGDR